MERVIKGVHIIPMSMANACLIGGDDGLTLIDAPTRACSPSTRVCKTSRKFGGYLRRLQAF